METVQIKGLRELRTALTKTIPVEMQGKILQKALAAGTRETLRQAKQNAVRGGASWPDRITGTLARAIYAKRSRWGNTKTLEYRVIGVRRGKKAGKANKDAFYWKFVEFGHRIGTRASGYLQKRDRGAGGRARGEVPAQPFMRPAFESTKNRAAVAIREALRRLIEEAAKKARWK